MSRSSTPICGVCLCLFGDSDCVHFNGRATTEDPFIPDFVFDESEANLAECGPAGFGAFLPPSFLDPPACHLYSQFDYPVAFDVLQPLFFEQERYDTDSMHDKENDSDRITFKTPGLYVVTLDVMWKKTNDNSATGDLAAFIREDGAKLLGFDSIPVGEGDLFAMQSVTVQKPFLAGQYVSAMVKHDIKKGNGKEFQNYIMADRNSPTFSAMFIRPLKGMNILGVPESG